MDLSARGNCRAARDYASSAERIRLYMVARVLARLYCSLVWICDLRTCLGERRARDTCCAINVAACVARKCKLTRAHPIRTEPNRTEMARAPVDLSRV